MQIYKTSVELPRWICAVLVGCGVLAYIATASIDIYYGGIATTIDKVGILIQSTSMLVVSGFTLGLGSFAGFLLRAGRWFWAAVLLCIATCFMCYSLSNGVGFVASQSVGKAKLLEANQKQAEDLAELQNQQVIENQNWLKRTYLQAKDKADKDKLLAQAVAPVEFKAPEIKTVMADARASVFSQLFGLKQETVQIGAAIALPVLLVLGKLLGPLLGFAFWPIGQPIPRKISASGEGDSNGTFTGGGGQLLPFPSNSTSSANSRFSATKEKTHANSIASSPTITAVPSRPLFTPAKKIRNREALADLNRLMFEWGSIPSQKLLSERWRRPESTVSRWVKEWETEGRIAKSRDGNCNKLVECVTSAHAPSAE